MLIPSPEYVDLLSVQQYQYLDDLRFVRSPAEVFDESKKQDIDRFLAALRSRFAKAGWEGDGEIGVVWLPPFVDIGAANTLGIYIWHVKQDHGGRSWLASESELNFLRLREQNEHDL
jgi:hypothetical protein